MLKLNLDYKVGDVALPARIEFTHVWGPKDLLGKLDESGELVDDCDGHTWRESWIWLNDTTAPEMRGRFRFEKQVYLLVMQNEFVYEVWEGRRNSVESRFTLIWKHKDEDETENAGK